MAKSKTKKRKNSDYNKSSAILATEEKQPEKKSTFARAQDRAEKRQKNKNKPKEKRENLEIFTNHVQGGRCCLCCLCITVLGCRLSGSGRHQGNLLLSLLHYI